LLHFSSIFFRTTGTTKEGFPVFILSESFSEMTFLQLILFSKKYSYLANATPKNFYTFSFFVAIDFIPVKNIFFWFLKVKFDSFQP